MKVAIIGGGAAGIFSAIHQKASYPNSDVQVFEKTDKLLSKVKISGGGRCNVTHACFSPAQLSKNYPRGSKFLKKAFSVFSTTETISWFESRGVRLKTEADGRMFPVTDSSQTIIDCLLNEARSLGVVIHLKQPVYKILKEENRFKLSFKEEADEYFDKLIIACGGFDKRRKYEWIEDLSHSIIEPIPSLFTMNMPSDNIRELAGVVAPDVSIHIQSTKLKSRGPLLITHWGMSGPAVLKLSAFGARILNQLNYNYTVQINWLGEKKDDEIRDLFRETQNASSKKKVKNECPFDLPKRLWFHLLDKSGIYDSHVWASITSKQLNKLIHNLLHDEYQAKGKTRFKEEFVTAGGVDLNEVDVKTMQSKNTPGLYFAGEVLDIDGVTGGFNFQAAWTTAYIAGVS